MTAISGRMTKLEWRIGPARCVSCGLPLSGAAAKIIRLRDGEREPRPCPTCGSKTLLVVYTKVVTAQA